jgi:hypothetical protein
MILNKKTTDCDISYTQKKNGEKKERKRLRG